MRTTSSLDGLFALLICQTLVWDNQIESRLNIEIKKAPRYLIRSIRWIRSSLRSFDDHRDDRSRVIIVRITTRTNLSSDRVLDSQRGIQIIGVRHAVRDDGRFQCHDRWSVLPSCRDLVPVNDRASTGVDRSSMEHRRHRVGSAASVAAQETQAMHVAARAC